MHSSIVRIFVAAAFCISLAGLTGCDTLGVTNIPADQMKEQYTTSAEPTLTRIFNLNVIN